MKTKIFKMTAIALMLAVSYTGKNKMNNDDEEVTDPEVAILGKWELVLVQNPTLDAKYPHTPNSR